MRTLSLRIRSWCVGAVNASVPDAHTQCTHQFLTRMLSMLWRDLFKFGIFMLMLSICVRNWYGCSGYASVPDAHAQCTHQFLTRAQCKHHFLTRMLRVYKMNDWKIEKLMRMLSMHLRSWCVTRMLRVRIFSWCVCFAFVERMHSVHVLVPDGYAQCTHQFLTRMLSVRISSWCTCSMHASVPDARSVQASFPYAHAKGIQNERLKNRKTDAHAEHALKELMRAMTRTLRVRISSWPVCSACA